MREARARRRHLVGVLVLPDEGYNCPILQPYDHTTSTSPLVAIRRLHFPHLTASPSQRRYPRRGRYQGNYGRFFGLVRRLLCPFAGHNSRSNTYPALAPIQPLFGTSLPSWLFLLVVDLVPKADQVQQLQERFC